MRRRSVALPRRVPTPPRRSKEVVAWTLSVDLSTTFAHFVGYACTHSLRLQGCAASLCISRQPKFTRHACFTLEPSSHGAISARLLMSIRLTWKCYDRVSEHPIAIDCHVVNDCCGRLSSEKQCVWIPASWIVAHGRKFVLGLSVNMFLSV